MASCSFPPHYLAKNFQLCFPRHIYGLVLFFLLSVTNDDCAHPLSLQNPFLTIAQQLKTVPQYLGPLLLALKQSDTMMKRKKKNLFFFPQTLM